MIEVEALGKRFGRTQAVSELSFSVQPGVVTGFLGPNGAGKSTTLRALLGLIRPDSGTARVLGAPYSELPRPLEQVGAVLEASHLHPGRSGRDHLRVLASTAGIPRSRVEEVLELVELTDDARRRTKGYSLGMRQRLGLAAALLGDPEVLVLDEPANGLDPQGIRWLRDLVRTLAGEGRTVLLSSHVLAEVAQVVDEVVIIHRGRLVRKGSVAELQSEITAVTIVRSPDPKRLAMALAAAGIGFDRSDDGAFLARADAPKLGELAAAAGVVLHELAPERASLEEVFLELTSAPGT